MKRRSRRIGMLGAILPALLTTAVGVTVVAVSASTTPASRAAAFDPHAPVGKLDKLYVTAGGIRTVGWTYDPDSPKTSIRVFARLDGVWAKGAAADLARPDLAKLHPTAGAAHGFDFRLPVPEGDHRVCILARNIQDGTDFTLGCLNRNFDYGPVGKVDPVSTTPGHLAVSGWTLDLDKRTAPLTVDVKIDDTVHVMVADKPRSDVTTVYPLAGADHGFAANFAVAQGTHQICITAVNVGYGFDNSLGCQSVTVNDDPLGALETLKQQSGKLRVIGWALDRDAPRRSLTVQVKIDGVTHSATANVSRTDIGAKYPGTGTTHGFDVSYAVLEGKHTVCVTAVNVGYGTNTAFPCQTITLDFTPTAAVLSLSPLRTGAHFSGWATDPDTGAAVTVDVTADGKPVTTVTANGNGSGHSGHVFTAYVPLRSGTHRVCATAHNLLYGTHNSTPACKSITLALKPLGSFETVRRASGSANLALRGWALDPDTSSPISVRVTVDGRTYGTVRANATRTDIEKKYPAYGTTHGLSVTVPATDGEHTVCLTALNVSGGTNLNLGCKLIIAVHPVAPGAVRAVSALAGYGGATVTWTPPAGDGGAPWSKYTVVSSPGNISVTVSSDATSATVLGLKPGTSYTFAVTATNVAGTSQAAVSAAVKTQSSPPNQNTPAPVSTSRYIRNIRGSSATEQAMMHSEGAADASFNPSGHGYLVLLDIGGQDQFDGGVVLSAGVRFVTYGDLVADLKAYVAGYASKQKASAPATIAIGTNNDMDVSSASGKTWATTVVGPVAAYAKKFPGLTIAGANDIEPGFRASYSATKSWLSGYLGATRAPFVFNGSADGCAWTVVNRGCNNGWTMSGLYYLAAGAAPVRMLNLPQIYNTTMAAQWKYISLTGVATSKPRINFGGTLTEWTACAQTNSCGSLTGHSAWTSLWNNLQSDTRLKVASLPYSTDLRIDK